MNFKLIIFAVYLISFTTVSIAENIPEERTNVHQYKCLVSDWENWKECQTQTSKPKTLEKVQKVAPKKSLSTIHMEPVLYDEGREWMKISMEQKEQYGEHLKTCRSAGTCPDLMMKESKSRVNCVDGLSGEYPCKLVDQLSYVSLKDMGSPDQRAEGNDIWGWTDPTTDREYAIVGITDGSSFVDITDAENPKVLAFLPTRTVRSEWRDMKVVNDHAYIVSEATDHGMQVYDLRQLRTITKFTVVKSTFDYTEIGKAHNIVSHPETNTVFIVGATRGNYPNQCNGGLHMVDVSDPAKPKFAGCFGDDGYVHDAQCLFYNGPDSSHRGKELCFCYNENTLTIVDVTDRKKPTMISKVGYTGSRYTHQGWLLEDHSALLMDDEQDEQNGLGDGRTVTYFWDIKDLENPKLMNTFISSEFAIDHNQYILGNYTYQTNYEAGLRILRINKEKWELTEVAYFDVMPKLIGEVVFQGSWSSYPYFKSRNIIVNSIEFGLFVVRPDYAAIENEGLTGGSFQKRVRKVIASTDEKYCPELMEKRHCQPNA